jgi:DNA (cytosine-5)-methyltransferase 1
LRELDLQAQHFQFVYTEPFNKVLTVKDALKKGVLYNSNCPESQGQIYPERKKKILFMVPQGGCWVNYELCKSLFNTIFDII